MSGNCSQDEGQFSGDDSSRIGNGTPVDPFQTVDTRYRNIALIIPKNNSPLTYFLFSPRGFSFFLRTARTIGGRKKGEKNSREISRSIIPHTFPRSRAGKSRRRVRGRERKCINAARNVRDDEVAVYTLYRMHEIFGSRESPLLRRGKVYESPWKLTFFMDRRRGERAAETAIYPRAATAYIVLSSEEASERRLLRVFEREDESTGGKR